jgi:N-methylhydantoinase A
MTYTIGVDVGGTFTDFLMINASAKTQHQHKTPTVPSDPATGILTGLSELAEHEGLTEAEFFDRISLIVHGTTVATNAVLTNSGAKTGLITTQGVRDILEMRRGIRSRKHLYDNKYVAPAPLVTRDLRKTVPERVDVDGRIVTPLDEEALRTAITELKGADVEAVAVCFMHSYANGDHERRVREILTQEAPDLFLSVSSEVLPQVRLYPRVSTTVINAYLGPIVQKYMATIVNRLQGRGFKGTLMVMQSNGGITRPEKVAHLPASITLSGPAAGPVAAYEFVNQRGWRDCTVVDMGGTSFDASLVLDGEVQITRDGEINHHVISLPTTHVHTIGSGGGSVAWIDDGGMLRVGPRSAGATPGPAAYGQGGTEPTVSDAAVALGYIDPDYFLGGRKPLHLDLAEEAIRTKVAEPLGLDVVEAAAGIYEMVNLQMAAGTKNVSVERGYDPREFPMVVAGGAGPVHAGMIAHELEVPVVVVPRLSSVLCAAGMLMADLRHDFVRAFTSKISEMDIASAAALVQEMVIEGQEQLASEGVPESAREYVVSADVRYPGQHHEVTVMFEVSDIDPQHPASVSRIADLFHDRHEQLYGFAERQEDVELMSLRVAAIGRRESLELGNDNEGALGEAVPKGTREVYLRSAGTKVPVPIYEGSTIPVGRVIKGPAVVEEPTTTIFVPEYFDIELDQSGSYFMVAKGFDWTQLKSLKKEVKL